MSVITATFSMHSAPELIIGDVNYVNGEHRMTVENPAYGSRSQTRNHLL